MDTSFWLDGSSYWLRHRPARRVRDDFYSWVKARYAGLIAQMQPSLGTRECERRAYAILTLVLGAWITHGRGSALNRGVSILERRQLLIDAALEIATQ